MATDGIDEGRIAGATFGGLAAGMVLGLPLLICAFQAYRRRSRKVSPYTPSDVLGEDFAAAEAEAGGAAAGGRVRPRPDTPPDAAARADAAARPASRGFRTRMRPDSPSSSDSPEGRPASSGGAGRVRGLLDRMPLGRPSTPADRGGGGAAPPPRGGAPAPRVGAGPRTNKKAAAKYAPSDAPGDEAGAGPSGSPACADEILAAPTPSAPRGKLPPIEQAPEATEAALGAAKVAVARAAGQRPIESSPVPQHQQSRIPIGGSPAAAPHRPAPAAPAAAPHRPAPSAPAPAPAAQPSSRKPSCSSRLPMPEDDDE